MSARLGSRGSNIPVMCEELEFLSYTEELYGLVRVYGRVQDTSSQEIALLRSSMNE